MNNNISIVVIHANWTQMSEDTYNVYRRKNITFGLVSIDCGNLMPPDNGMLNSTAGMHGNNTLNATATYTCDLGFNLSGIAQRTCTDTSEWLPGAPNCTLSRKSLQFITVHMK